MMDPMSGWGPGLGAVLMIVFVGLAIVGAVALLKRLLAGSAGPDKAADKTPLEILKQRYARGEINLEQYKQARSELEN